MTCTPSPNSFALPDPLMDLPAPTRPALAAGMKESIGTTLVPVPANIPPGCPGDTGTNRPSDTTPHLCTLGQGGSQAEPEVDP